MNPQSPPPGLLRGTSAPSIIGSAAAFRRAACKTPVMTLDPSRLADAIRSCDLGEVVKAMDENTGVLHALFETMEEFRGELIHVLKNPPQEWTIAMEERPSHRTRCEACDGVAEDLSEAVDDCWYNLRAVDGDACDYLGMCPTCHDDGVRTREEPKSTETHDAPAKQALQALLACAELNQDDIEEETRTLIDKIHALLTTVTDSIACFECDVAAPTLPAAVENGWRDLQVDPHSNGRYRGLCPDCHEKAVEREFEEAELRRRGRITENKTLFD